MQVRDSLGLTYDVSFEVTLFDRIRQGWFMVHVTSHPDKVRRSLGGACRVPPCLHLFLTSSHHAFETALTTLSWAPQRGLTSTQP